MKFWHAEYVSRNSHLCLRHIEEDAIAAMLAALRNHATQCRIPNADWYCADDITVREIEMGAGYRDGEKVELRSK
jgi:hypothetical protein